MMMNYVQEKLYVELKTILGRQPGPEVAEQLAVYQENLKQKVRASSTVLRRSWAFS